MKQLILILTLVATTFVNAQEYADLTRYAGLQVSGSHLDNLESYYTYTDTDVSTNNNLTNVPA